jgi:putative transposase
MEQQGGSVRKTYKYKLKPAPQQEWDLERVVLLCHHLYDAAIGERREAWRMRGVVVTYYQQQAELPAIKEAMPEYAEVNAQVLQNVVQRVDRAFEAFFQRLRDGATAGYPRFHGRDRYNSFTYPQVGKHGGARLDSGFLILSKIGRIAVRWSRALEPSPGGHTQDGSPLAGRRMAGMPASPARMCPSSHCPRLDKRRASTLA